jgi:DNA-binding NarL/FixJ family response regulator
MRVVIAEDEALLRRGLELMLGDADFEVVATVADAPALERAVFEHQPDLVVTDIRMPPNFTDDGLRVALRIRAQLPQTAVVVLSQHVQRRYAVELLSGHGGGVGYLLKQRISDVDEFLSDLRRIAKGGTAIDPDVVAVMVSRARRSDSAVGGLTVRQQEVLALMAEGRSNASIAGRLFLSEKAVVQHASRIYDALSLAVDSDAHRRVLAVLQYLNRDG